MTTEEEDSGEEAYRLNKYWLSLRIIGEIEAQERLAVIVGSPPDEMRNSQGIARRRNPQVAVFRLAEWLDDKNSKAILLQFVPQIRAWTPGLHELQSLYQCRIEIHISAFRNTDQGGIDFPLDFVRALADAALPFGISIQARFLWDDDEEDD